MRRLDVELERCFLRAIRKITKFIDEFENHMGRSSILEEVGKEQVSGGANFLNPEMLTTSTTPGEHV